VEQTAIAPPRLKQRFRDYLQRSRRLSRAGVRLDSLLLFPLRRRLPNPCNRIDLKEGLVLTSPPNEPLLALFQELWLEECYTRGRFTPGAGHLVVDVGAHVGIFTVWAASRHPEVRVLAVEPSPRSFQFLQENVACNGLQNVTLVRSACGRETGEAQLYSRGRNVADTLCKRDAAGRELAPLASTPVLGLDALFKRYRVNRCDLLKLDCEGAEYEILFNAARDTLARIERIAMEYHVGLGEHTPLELGLYLEAHGFKVEREGPQRDDEGGYLYASRRGGARGNPAVVPVATRLRKEKE
jgi:FkbM family methyltransferase